MTSKRLFFKALGEDMRHRVWTAALAGLVSFLMLPVAYLAGASSQSMDTMTVLRYVREFYGSYYPVAGIVYTVVGALIVGIAGFRFVFHRQMTDTYHALPIRRNTWYWACYANGFFIWLLPLALGLFVTLALSLGDLSAAGAAGDGVEYMVKTAFQILLALLILFLVVYHLALTAVMLSGNVLNTLVSTVILGCGVIGVWGLGVGMLETYMSTVAYSPTISRSLSVGIRFSPLVSAVSLAVDWAGNLEKSVPDLAGLGGQICANLLAAALLGTAAYVLYRKRPSELAEQGVKNKAARAFMQFLAGGAAGLGGWLFFTEITDGGAGWGVFGTLLFGVLAFGVTNMIFRMEFKAFFAHRLQIAVTAALCLLTGFAFRGDWFGFDHYLPSKEKVAEIALLCGDFSNTGSSWEDTENGQGSMHLTDVEASYAFLERMAGRGLGWYSTPVATTDSFTRPASTLGESEEVGAGGRTVQVRVTLTNGRSYYRSYYVSPQDKDVVWPLLVSSEYMRSSYRIPLEDIASYDYMRFYRSGREITVEEGFGEQARTILAAYNRDVEEYPEAVLGSGKGRLMTEVGIRAEDSQGQTRWYTLDVYDTMQNTIEALRQTGWGEWAEDIAPAQIHEISLLIDDPQSLCAGEGALDGRERAAAYFGLEGTKGETVDDAWMAAHQVTIEEYNGEKHLFSCGPGDAIRLGDVPANEVMTIRVNITSPQEIEELVGLLGYAWPNDTNFFEPAGLGVTVTVAGSGEDAYGSRCYIRKGDLPEKYAALFGPALDAIQEAADPTEPEK